MKSGLFWVSVAHIRDVIIKFTLIFHGIFREEEKRAREEERDGIVWGARRASTQNCGTIYDSSPFVERHEGFPEIALNA